MEQQQKILVGFANCGAQDNVFEQMGISHTVIYIFWKTYTDS